MSIKIHDSWKTHLQDEFEQEYFQKLTEFVRSEYERTHVYPAPKNIFRAFDLCTFEDLKVVILGQDPYHGPDQANGLCFAVNDGIAYPPSLQNIFKEMDVDIGGTPKSGDLLHLAKQGVLLLNATLTVLASTAGAHQGKGWEEFTDSVMRQISEKCENIVFILWGRYAQDKGKMIDPNKHLIIKSAHPSPLSAYRGFFGSKPFSKANEYLAWHGKDAIDWTG